MDASGFLLAIRREFDWHVRQHRGTEVYRAPSLTNPVLPMFALDRWATGPGQDTFDIYTIMRPALQLASMWLTEDLPLLWFSHLTFGHRRRNAAGQVYLERNPHYRTPAALKTVKENLHEFGKTNFFAFAPPKCKNTSYATTYSKKESIPHFREFNHADFPPVLSDKGILKPCIILTRGFVKSFRSRSVSANERYRSLFMFAIDLCHEVTHSYSMFHDGSIPEPLWAANEKFPELGYSWEMSVLGHLPMSNSIIIEDGRSREINSVCMLEASSHVERDRLLSFLKGNSRAEFTRRDASGNYRSWPVLHGGGFRGAKWTMSNNAQLLIASFHVIPMHWMVSWFQQDVWEILKIRWAQNNLYEAPALGQKFMVRYERSTHGVSVHRPLYPNNRVDAKIIEDHRKEAQK
ncbi:hypothetical protein BKA58DRAFT_437167 [Alternaria rosae]|uniref:uncharacterized protein n=1 Tax=Alternaria rosae TaxID=1187941 RepID=UPI001E8DE5E3|nr:uncharacterized protein BKA58DRAFT_437167 [Alternaria rosae]KAH6875176.1 hypothetical protein BKA58DRAFT_437167 [Alternaria rosae]